MPGASDPFPSHKRSASDGRSTMHVWKVLSRTLPSQDANSDAWWQLTGKHLAVLLNAAGYPVDRQFECLLYHYHYAAPYLGPAPRGDNVPSKWKSMLQLDGTPFEFSWRWDTADGGPDVRIGLEPIGPMAGTTLDPLNHLAIREVLHKLASAVPGTDLTWTHHFLATLFDHDYAKYTEESSSGTPIGTSLFLSLDFLRDLTQIKTYFQPRMLNQPGLLDIPRWEASFQKLHPDAPARRTVHKFLTSNPEGKLLKPFCLSIMTLGGRITSIDTDHQLFELFDLLRTVTEQTDSFHETSEFPYTTSSPPSTAPNSTGCVYFFDIAPGTGQSLPAIKLYFPIRNHGRNDFAATQNLMRWLDSRGRGQNGDAFLRALEAVADYRQLDEGGGLLSFLSCQFRGDGELELTSYFNPEAYHSARVTHRRGTRRRGDW